LQPASVVADAARIKAVALDPIGLNPPHNTPPVEEDILSVAILFQDGLAGKPKFGGPAR
jgi:hypothetical protein